MGRLFGTDGVRGLANADLTPELALDLAIAAAHVLIEHRSGGGRASAVVGRDPRASGEMLESAVCAGLASAGVDVIRLGVLPTPGVAYLACHLGADLGVMLSASHNAMPDNGIKFFDRDGYKLPDEVEDEIEARIREPWQRPTGGGVGRVSDRPELIEDYVAHLVSCAPARLDGLSLVVDCANGAASMVAPEVYRRLGAAVTTLADSPDGWNINDGVGSTHPETLQAAVVASGADAGVAHDGDADRCIAVDANGQLVDGDGILTVVGLAARDAGRLANDTIVCTVMANLGFKKAMRAHGVSLIETPVGDRYVLEEMRRGGHTLGGEQSGHVLFLDHATTGDGVLTAVQLFGAVAASGKALHELAGVMTTFPQVLRNVRVADRDKVMASEVVAAAVADAEARLGDSGRVLVRASGTEPLVRVMVEAASAAQAETLTAELVAVVEAL
ncbi:MAG: phosphoglucosamine mutase [Frankiales bacterium]|nr:phosphoglucosamine mutase [Frankiales bacterium]